jgi:hypothetical protein
MTADMIRIQEANVSEVNFNLEKCYIGVNIT